jgi:hypothetical protein
MVSKTKDFSENPTNTEKPSKNTIPLYNNRNCGNSVSDFGCDKLKIYLIKEGYSWKKERLKGWGQKTITTDSGTSDQFFYNPEALGFNLDISKDQRTQEEYLTITTNPSKKIHPYKLINDADIITEQLGKIENHLRDKFSIELDMELAKVSRIDLAHNIQLNHPLKEYTSVLDTFRPSRQMSKTHADSYYFSNKSRQSILYNKQQELIDNKIKNIPNNLSRFEERLLNSSSVKTVYNDNKLSTILMYTHKNVEIFNSYITQRLFRQQKIPTLKLDFGEFETIYENCILQYGRKEGHRIAIESFGVHTLAKTENGIKFFYDLIDKYQEKRTAFNLKRRVDKLLDIYDPVEFDINDNSFITLNRELRHKLLVAA